MVKFTRESVVLLAMAASSTAFLPKPSSIRLWNSRQNTQSSSLVSLKLSTRPVSQAVVAEETDASQTSSFISEIDSKETTREENTTDEAKSSPFEALEHFLAVSAEQNQKESGSIRFVSRGSTKLPPHQATQTVLFSNESTNQYVVVIVPETSSADADLLNEAIPGGNVSEVKDEMEIVHKCGFSLGTIPPIGHSSTGLNNISIIIDSQLIEKCQTEDLLLLGGGGHPYWQSLASPNSLVSYPNVQVAPISSSSADDDESSSSSTASSLRSTSSILDLSAKPTNFASFLPPPMNIAKLVVSQRDLSNPLTPSLVTISGRIGKVESKGKKLSNCQFLPLEHDEADESSLPWTSPNGVSMAINIVAGKAVLQHLGKKQGEVAIETLQAGTKVEILAKTNVGNRDSLLNWAERETLDLIAMDYSILGQGETKDLAASSENPHKHKSQKQEEMEASMPILPSLTMDDVFGQNNGKVELVDSVDTLKEFQSDIDQLLSNDITKNGDPSAALVGIDCEWQPRDFLNKGDPQPVLLMQVSLQALQKVYVLDLQTLLRPLEAVDEEMNEIENALNGAFSVLFASKNVLKTGYQLSSDLRRIAASYPHIPAFQNVESVLEVSTMIKRILHISKQKKSRSITMSLAKMASHYLEKTIDKQFQISNWAQRPLDEKQMGYAALDAAVSPALACKALESIDASIDTNIPILQRFDGDSAMKKEIESFQFSVYLKSDDGSDGDEIPKKAKNIVGPSWVKTDSWVTK